MQADSKRRKHNFKNCSGNRKPLQQRKIIESRSAALIKPQTIFRNHLLNNSLAIKSGYLFSEYDNKLKLARYWLNVLKKHEGYIPIEIQKGCAIDDALMQLHKETDRLFSGYDWILKYETETVKEIKIYYYESLGDIGMHNLPIEWFANHKNEAFKKIGLTIIKLMSEKFGISIINNDMFDMVLDNCKNDNNKFDEDVLKKYIIEWYGYDETENEDEIKEIVDDIKSYVVGNVFNLKHEIDKLQESDLSKINSLLKKMPLELSQWLSEAKEVLSNPCDIHDFDFVPFDIKRENGDPVTIEHSIFFPYSFYDKPMEQYEQWLNDISSGTGINDIYKYGILSKDYHITPTDEEPLFKLIQWLDKGRELYFNEIKK
jgi:hypothetical protein